MSHHPTFVPAIRTEARSQCLGWSSVRTSEGLEVGRLVGFVIDSQDRRISRLVMEVGDGTGMQQLEMPMVPLRVDPRSRALCMVEPGAPKTTPFHEELVTQIDEQDLWVPLIDHAA